MVARSNLAYEESLATLAVAGFRALVEDSVSVAASGTNSYTSTHAETRRVVALHLGSDSGDIRFSMLSTATATDMPLLPLRYISFECKAGETVYFYNTSGGSITIYLMEVP